MVWNTLGNAVVWNPWSDVRRLQDEVDRWYRGFATGQRTPLPRANVHASDDEVLVDVELPGFSPEDVEAQVEDGVLTLSGTCPGAEGGAERVFKRSFSLPFRVETEGVEARMQDGLLSVRLPRAEADKPRQIAVMEA